MSNTNNQKLFDFLNKKLLENPQITVAQAMSEFSNINHQNFYKFFSKKLGESPQTTITQVMFEFLEGCQPQSSASIASQNMMDFLISHQQEPKREPISAEKRTFTPPIISNTSQVMGFLMSRQQEPKREPISAKKRTFTPLIVGCLSSNHE